MRADSILGDDADSRFSGRRRHHVDIGWGDAAKQRQLVIADSGLEVRLMLPRGTFLADGAVIADDGHEIVVVRRPSEPAITVRFDRNSDAHGARSMLLLGYALGNQHAPIDVDHDTLAAPLFTSVAAAQRMLADLGVEGLVTETRLAVDGWSRTSGDQSAAHSHAHSHD